MKGRDILKDMVGTADQLKSDTPPTAPHRPAGAVRAMNLSLARLGEEAATARTLRESLASGQAVVELDPAQVETSFIRDRIPIENDPELTALTLSIRESGQQVPILVRPHPSRPNAFQAAFGHRRLQAAAEIGIPVKALVRHLSDEELVLAQGQENGARVNLSFIERALFALRMEEHGFDRETIARALATDKPETSRLLQVAELVPSEIILAIGPAPKVGRPRWLAFAEKLKNPSLHRKALSAASDLEFLRDDSNKRFERLWRVLESKSRIASAAEQIRTRNGTSVASLTRDRKAMKLTVISLPFADYLARRMDDLVAEFEAENEATTGS